jgi:hypothetical protein
VVRLLLDRTKFYEGKTDLFFTWGERSALFFPSGKKEVEGKRGRKKQHVFFSRR